MARDVASRLRLKRVHHDLLIFHAKGGQGRGFSLEIETHQTGTNESPRLRGQGRGFSLEIETLSILTATTLSSVWPGTWLLA